MIKKPEIVSWSDIREDVHKVNSKLANILDDLDIKNDPNFCKIEYPYGANIFDDRRMHGISSANLQSSISFDYGEYPLGLILNKSLTASIETKKRFVPLHVFYPGQFFGFWELFDRDRTLFKWNLYSGARAIFSATKISNATKYQTIKQKFGLKTGAPKYLKDHYTLFEKIINHSSASTDWKSTALFFSEDFKKQILEKKSLLPLKTYLYEYSWKQSMPWRFEAMMRVTWNRVSHLLKKNQFKNFSLQLSTLKHIVKVALGASPCFSADDPEEITAPINLIKEVLIDDYKVDFSPTILVPKHLTDEKNNVGYHSVNESIPVEDTYTNKTKKTSIETMRTICEIYEFIKTCVFDTFNDDVYVNNDMTQLLTEGVKLDFFHSQFDQRELLQMSSILPEQDPSLIQLPKKYGKSTLPFNENGSFFRGLIRIKINNFSFCE